MKFFKKITSFYFNQDGMIDYRYRIQGLILNEVRPVSKATIQLGKSGVISEIPSMAHPRRMTFIDGGSFILIFHAILLYFY